MIKGIIRITRVADNVTREYIYEYSPGEEEDVRFLFEEGNYACDCNRALFFARAGGEPDPEDRCCGNTRFRVDLSLLGGLIDGAPVIIAIVDEVFHGEDRD